MALNSLTKQTVFSSVFRSKLFGPQMGEIFYKSSR